MGVDYQSIPVFIYQLVCLYFSVLSDFLIHNYIVNEYQFQIREVKI